MISVVVAVSLAILAIFLLILAIRRPEMPCLALILVVLELVPELLIYTNLQEAMREVAARCVLFFGTERSYVTHSTTPSQRPRDLALLSETEDTHSL